MSQRLERILRERRESIERISRAAFTHREVKVTHIPPHALQETDLLKPDEYIDSPTPLTLGVVWVGGVNFILDLARSS